MRTELVPSGRQKLMHHQNDRGLQPGVALRQALDFDNYCTLLNASAFVSAAAQSTLNLADASERLVRPRFFMVFFGLFL